MRDVSIVKISEIVRENLGLASARKRSPTPLGVSF
jgi:hypothetical protein